MNIDRIIEREFAKTKDYGGYAPRIYLQESELRALLLEAVEAERKDAERYRFLLVSDWYIGPEPEIDSEAVSWSNFNATDVSLTVKVDAAIAAEGK